MRYTILVIIWLAAVQFCNAQPREMQLQVGYLGPYITNVGVTVGHAMLIRKFEGNDNQPAKHTHRLRLLKQVGYFAQPGIGHNLIVNPELAYLWNRTGKLFFLSSSLGVGYLLSFQRQDGTLHLGTGEIEYRSDALNYFVPTINVGLGTEPRKHIGFFFKAFYGAKLSAQAANSAFFGLATGITVNLHSKVD